MATLDASDCCLVCAEPLEFTGIGPCGHRDLCSRCVARMRFVLKDTKCVLCKQECPTVFFTRFMGDYTARPPEEPVLKDREQRGELFLCSAVNGYFDDPKHYEEINYTHPIIADGPTSFSSMPEMRRHIEAAYRLSFCDLCLISRKLLYTKAQLERHNRQGDETGPLAESSFKGHPICKFCRQRFFDSQELWRHMENTHEHCFLCRRASPDKYVYYRHYKELEEHFRNEHHLCPHQHCLEKKFVVFTSENDLRRHFASEHGDELKLSRAQRREALSVPVQLQYRSRDDADAQQLADALELAALHERAGIVIGGGQGVTGRHGPRGASSAVHHSRSEPSMNAAVQASMDTAQSEAATREQQQQQQLDSVTFSASDFPSIGAAHSSGASMQPIGAIWLSCPSAAGGGGGGGSLANEDEFPALPSLTQSAKKRIKDRQQAASMAQRLSATPGAAVSRGANGSTAALDSLRAAFPPLGSSVSAAAAPGPPAAPAEAPLPAAPPSPAPPAAAAGNAAATPPPRGAAHGGSVTTAASFLALGNAPGAPPAAAASAAPSEKPMQPPPALDDFPALPSSSAPRTRGTAAAAPVRAAASTPGDPAAAFKAAAERASSARPSAVPAGSSSHQVPAISADDFPSLGRAPAAAVAASRRQQQGPCSSAPSVASNSSLRGGGSAASASSAPQGGVSEALKSANRDFINKARLRLNSEAQFDAFREDSSKFLRGALPAPEYHLRMVALGLLNLVPEAATLCPQADRRAELIAAHLAFLSSDAANDTSRLGAGWVPPEAALVAVREAERQQCWSCPRCTLNNAASAQACEACAQPLQQQQQGGGQPDDQDFPSLGSRPGSAPSSKAPSAPASKGKAGSGRGKGTIISIGWAKHGTGHVQREAAPSAPPSSAWAGQGNAALKRRVEEQRQLLAQSTAARSAWAHSGA